MVYLLKQLFLPVFVALNSVLAYRCLFSEDDAVRDILDTWSPGRVLTEEPLSDFERHMLHVMGAACLCFLLTELTAIYLDDARYQFCTLLFQTLFFAVDGYSYLKMGKEMAETPLAQAIGLGILGLGLHGLSIDLFGIEDVDTGAATGTPSSVSSSVQVGTHTNTTTTTTKMQHKKKNQKSSDKTKLVNGITTTRPNGTTSTLSSGRTSDNTNNINYNHKDSTMDEEGDIDPEIREMFAATSAALDAATAELVNGAGAGAEKSKNNKKKNKKKNGITSVVDGSSSDNGTSSNGHTNTTTTTTDRKFPPPSAAAAAAFLQEKRETDTIRMVHMNTSSSMPIDGKDVPALIEDSE